MPSCTSELHLILGTLIGRFARRYLAPSRETGIARDAFSSTDILPPLTCFHHPYLDVVCAKLRPVFYDLQKSPHPVFGDAEDAEGRIPGNHPVVMYEIYIPRVTQTH